MKSIDQYLSRNYHRRDYNCLHFARDIILDFTDFDIGVVEFATRNYVRRFKRISHPEDFCLVLMSNANRELHIGVYLQNNLLHLRRQGAEFLPIEVATRGYRLVRYYHVENGNRC